MSVGSREQHKGLKLTSVIKEVTEVRKNMLGKSYYRD